MARTSLTLNERSIAKSGVENHDGPCPATDQPFLTLGSRLRSESTDAHGSGFVVRGLGGDADLLCMRTLRDTLPQEPTPAPAGSECPGMRMVPRERISSMSGCRRGRTGALLSRSCSQTYPDEPSLYTLMASKIMVGGCRISPYTRGVDWMRQRRYMTPAPSSWYKLWIATEVEVKKSLNWTRSAQNRLR
jgi:hypothetical protein